MYYLLVCVVIIVDRISKMFVQNHMGLGESIPVISNVFHWTYILNRGAAFGILEEQQWFFLTIVGALMVIAFIYREWIRNATYLCKIGVALLFGGAIGNGWDRFQQGAVVDFFDFRVWPIFNVADIAICVGVALICVYLLQDSAHACATEDK